MNIITNILSYFFQQILMCDKCGAKKKSQKQMTKHLLVHKGKKILKCRVCSKIYDDRNHLKEHEDIHITGGKHYSRGEKLEDGTLCSAHYSGKGSIRLHMMNGHKKKLAKSSYMRKPDDQLTYQMLEEYEKQV